MKVRTFFLLLLSIVLFGLLLRIHEYEKSPLWNESLDEIHYAWTGMTWITEGTPKSWSWLSSYPSNQMIRLWNTDFRIVSPMLEKPPLYSLLSGINVLLAGENELDNVTIATIRLLPLVLSVFTIFLTGLLGKKVFSPAVGLLAALLYAVTPPIVLANRLSVTENLLTPLFLSVQIMFLYFPLFANKSVHIPAQTGMKSAVLIGFISGLAALTKQAGLSVVIASSGLFIHFKQWKLLTVSAAISLVLFSVYPLTGAIYDWQLFKSIQTEQRRIGLQGGLPELVQTMLARPLITTERLFPDGILLLGFFLLFISPWIFSSPWRKRERSIGTFKDSIVPPSQNKFEGWRDFRMTMFLAFPFAYLIYLILAITGAEPIGSGQGYWGWYSFPFFPYLVILVAVIFTHLWNEWNVFKGIIVGAIIGSSMIRYALLFSPRQWHHRWQYALMGIFFIILICSLQKPEYRKRILIVLFILFVGVSLFTSFNIDRIY